MQFVYHLIIAIVWAAASTAEYDHYPNLNCFLYWVSMLFTLILLGLSIFIRIRIDFLINPLGDIERLEVEEMRREQMEKEEDDKFRNIMNKQMEEEELKKRRLDEMKRLKEELRSSP